MSEDIPPVRVHLVADSTKGPAPRERHAARYRTITLTAAQPVAVVAATEPLRHRVTLVVGATNAVWVTDTEQAALAVANAGTGGGADSAAQLPAGTNVRYETTENIWCAATAYPAILSVIITSAEG